MIRDYWIYQKRQSGTAQWAIYVVKEFYQDLPHRTCLDLTIYSEDIANETDSVSFIGWRFEKARGYAKAIADILEEFTEVTACDVEQIETEISRILDDRATARKRRVGK